MVDIHAHLLPGVDDGPRDIDSALALIEQGLEDGIGTWVATPHVLGAFDRRIDEYHQSVFAMLCEETARRGLPAELYLASEMMFGVEIEDMKERKTATFGGNGRYFLLEYPMMQFPVGADEWLFKAQLAGFRPIIAHPERNADLGASTALLGRLAHRGILFQVNSRSLSRDARPQERAAAEAMVRDGLVNFVASDAHDPANRPALLRGAYDRVAELADEATARRLLIENPRAAIEGGKIRSSSREGKVLRRWWHKFSGGDRTTR